CVTVAEGVSNTEFLLSSHQNAGEVSFSIGQFSRAQAHLERAVALYDPDQHASHAFLGADPWIMSAGFLALNEHWIGRFHRAVRRSRDVVARAREDRSHLFDLGLALVATATLHQFRREAKATLELAEAARALFSELGAPDMLGLSLWMRGWALSEIGEEAGIGEITEGISLFRSCGARHFLVLAQGLLASANQKIGQIEGASRALEEGFALAQETRAWSSARRRASAACCRGSVERTKPARWWRRSTARSPRASILWT
ncbi:MAG: hypothetical protein ACREQ9_06075, partial [Candidatus Binatia bacterium]